ANRGPQASLVKYFLMKATPIICCRRELLKPLANQDWFQKDISYQNQTDFIPKADINSRFGAIIVLPFEK
ncbi:MAG TPA: hypothetical protein VFK30_09850, partial [Anaerolineae bacterium]|nr:hypothetical protein [Anaerolineae bacterium]